MRVLTGTPTSFHRKAVIAWASQTLQKDGWSSYRPVSPSLKKRRQERETGVMLRRPGRSSYICWKDSIPGMPKESTTTEADSDRPSARPRPPRNHGGSRPFTRWCGACAAAAFLQGCSDIVLFHPKGPVADAERTVIIAALLLNGYCYHSRLCHDSVVRPEVQGVKCQGDIFSRVEPVRLL
jgi:hypothetical protein